MGLIVGEKHFAVYQATRVSSVHAKNNQICINLLIKMIHGYFDT